jgi:basic amino acid/polyamine antiporter, APA family
MVRLAAAKQVPTALGHMTHGHPYVSVVGGAVLYVLLIVSGSSQVVINLANITALFALIIVNIAAAKALASASHTGLRLPFGWLLPVLGTAAAAGQLFFIPIESIIIGAALALSGSFLYLLRRRLHKPFMHQQISSTVDTVQGPLGRSLH